MMFDDPEKISLLLANKAKQNYFTLFIDFDGTLAPLQKNPDSVSLDKRNRELLRSLKQSPHLEPIIVSGRDHHFLKKTLGDLGIKSSSEHGCEFYDPISEKITSLGSKANPNTLKDILSKLSDFISKFTGIHIEEKRNSVALHYRNLLDKENESNLLDEIRTALIPFSSECNVIYGNKVVEVCFTANTKGEFVKWYSTNHLNADVNLSSLPILCIGDDVTDETMFEYSNHRNGFSIKVGEGISSAMYRLENVDAVSIFFKTLLDNLEIL